MGMVVSAILLLAAILAALAGLACLGLKMKPSRFPLYPEPTPELQTVPVTGHLPPPVARFFQLALGDRAPLIRSAVVTGRGSLRLGGLRFPARYRFTHQAGQGYRHYIETTLFGRPLFKVNEWYLDGRCRMELPVGVIENDPKTDRSANLGLWGETVFLPALFLTDPRVRWEPVDETRARLLVPFGAETDGFTAAFDAETGMLRSLEAMRWKSPASAEKTGWRIDLSDWQRFHGMLVPTRWALTWADEAGPWFAAALEEVSYNVDVDQYIRATGP